MNIFIQTSTNVICNEYLIKFSENQSAPIKVGEQENISMFSTCSELTPRAPIPDDRMEQIMQPCVYDYALLICIYEYQHSTPHKTLNCCNEFFQWSWKIRCLRFIAHSCVRPHVSSSSVSSHHRQASHTNFINRFSSHIMSCSDRPGPSTFHTFLTFSKKKWHPPTAL